MFRKKIRKIRVNPDSWLSLTYSSLPPPSLSSDLVAATAVAVGFAADAAKEEAPSEY
jgi:hypothetical protein